MTAITIVGLTKRFGSTVAVDDVHLTVNAGELFFLLGPSGCGKTTLLRLIAGFIEPDSGSIRFDDRDITSLPPNRRNTGMVFQSYALWPHMTVEQNVAYGLDVRRIAAREKRERVLHALKLVHMHDYAQRRPGQLSGGQQQRVALARALVIQPSVLLLDEPLSNLDAKLRAEMRWEIRRICTETKITTVYVTHDQKEALSMADALAVMRDGRIVQVGPPRLLYERPESRFVADFLGETNFVPGVVLADEANGPSAPNSPDTTAASVRLETPLGILISRSVANAPARGNVTCSIRPEAVRIIEDERAPAPQRHQFTGRLVRTTYLGDFALHHIELGDRFIIRALETSPRASRVPGDNITIEVDQRDIVMLRD